MWSRLKPKWHQTVYKVLHNFNTLESYHTPNIHVFSKVVEDCGTYMSAKQVFSEWLETQGELDFNMYLFVYQLGITVASFLIAHLEPTPIQNWFGCNLEKPLKRDEYPNILFVICVVLLRSQMPSGASSGKWSHQGFPQTHFPRSSQAHTGNSQRHPYGIGRLPSPE